MEKCFYVTQLTSDRIRLSLRISLTSLPSFPYYQNNRNFWRVIHSIYFRHPFLTVLSCFLEGFASPSKGGVWMASLDNLLHF